MNERQMNLIQLLLHQNQTGPELAKKLTASKRTILRDIHALNDELILIAQITAVQDGYSLSISNEERFNQIFKTTATDAELILFELATRDFVTLDDLSDILFLSKPMLTEKITLLKQNYTKRLKIISKKNYGHFLDEPKSRKVILLANLILQKPAFFLAKLGLAPTLLEQLTENIRSARDAFSYEHAHSAQIASLCVSIYALQYDIRLTDTKINDCLRQSDMSFSDDIGSMIRTFLAEQNQIIDSITTGKILDLLQMTYDEHQAPVYDMELAVSLANHLKRSIAYPIILADKKLHNIANIKALYPLAFDLSIHFIGLVNQTFDVLIYDIDLVGLYFSCAMDRVKTAPIELVLFSNQYAVASINKQTIERAIPEVNVTLAMNAAELQNSLQNQAVKLILNNHDGPLPIVSITSYTIRQIMTEMDLRFIRDLLEKIDIERHLEDYFPQTLTAQFKNEEHATWHAVIQDLTTSFVEKGIISASEQEKIVSRESEGNNLVINHLAVPHCTTNRGTPFIGIFVHLEHPVQIEGETVQNVLLSCINPNVRNELKIFSYLYYTLNKIDSSVILSWQTHAEFMASLKQKD
ncbi:frv operon regulatory protein [Listeria fleischmannii 1991]|uniref:Frv operon regulatory protein n=1 Tax=Listeria fleischmannii 1991 TaxID=1430899 RepID=A0A0J8GAT0_9LIST|nr:PTS sugar transporter subunit IIA [Listeria fleischmannii]EMG26911.1 frv operon regulatory protein [Listeria fleischmannii subsp. fleischmannii LU2006-1]KMT57918.1 frv operon regulatory protein [Listeria fleischmannii 1991]